jgi:2-polyprenyl-3-methyl-5-hydroxy-6-metoxy-1,4-benzoquinol methylase
LAQQHGWDAIGVDVSRWAADQIQRRYGIRVIVGSLEEAAFASGTFDVVHMSHVLEHVPDPIGMLREVRRVLSPTGRVIIEVPNELENVYTWARLRSGTARAYPVASSHLWFFSPTSLARVVKATGFTIDQARSFRDMDDIRALRRIGKRIVNAIEHLAGSGPLIEVIAHAGVEQDGA